MSVGPYRDRRTNKKTFDPPPIAVTQDLLNIAPKRANWDLKRDLEKKLQPLERKTKESIYALVRELDHHRHRHRRLKVIRSR